MTEYERRGKPQAREATSPVQRPALPVQRTARPMSPAATLAPAQPAPVVPAAFQMPPARVMTATTAQRQAVRPVLKAAALGGAAQAQTRQTAQTLAVQRQAMRESQAVLAENGLSPQPEHLLPRFAPPPQPPQPYLTPVQRQVLSATADNTISSALSANARYLPPAARVDLAAQAVQRFGQQGLDPEPLRDLMVQRAPDDATREAALNAVSVQRRHDQEGARQRSDHALLTQHAAIQRQLKETEAQHAAHQADTVARIEARRGGGQPLPDAVRQQLELGLNHDLSGVRVHIDSEADLLAKGMGAVAFTSGKDIYFQSGEFDPVNKLELLAHEAAHVKQQDSGKVGPGVDPDAGLENEAQAFGKQLAAQPTNLTLLGAKKTTIQAPLTVQHAVQRQAAGNGNLPDKLMKELGEAVKSQDLNKALDLLRKLNRPQQQRALTQLLKQFGQGLTTTMSEGMQAMIDGLSGKIPEAIKRVARKAVQAGPWKPSAKQPVPFYLGTEGHNAIAAYYVSKHIGEQIFTNTRPMSKIIKLGATRLTKEEQGLKPDIVNLTKKHLYEIKPRSQAGLAIAEANLYLSLFKKAQVPMDLGPINDPGVIGIVPAPGGHYSFQAIAPGAVVYDYRRGEYQPEPVQVTADMPAVVPAPVPGQTPAREPQPATKPQAGGLLDSALARKAAEVTGLSGTALLLYLLISEASRVIPARNLVPLP